MSKMRGATAEMEKDLERFIAGVRKRNPGEPEFVQAVREVAATIIPYIADKPLYREMQILERMAEPDRVIYFRVPWTDDRGNIRNNRGFRVQFNGAIGPYKGGIRFHPSVNLSVLKFLGFEQTFKNSLTGLPMGGGKGGANFNPKGKSDNEVMRFCQSYMTELYRHIGEDTDVPAGDIGVGEREIGYMFGQYRRITNRFAGVLTGKGLAFGGSRLRTEATGYGCAYFMEDMLNHVGDGVKGKRCVVSGAGNVALHCVEKILDLGGVPLTLSDSDGFVYEPHGLSRESLAWIKTLKIERRGRIAAYAEHSPRAEYHRGRPWGVACDLAFPCATENEIGSPEARTLIGSGLKALCEGANMPSEPAAVEAFMQAGVLFGPGKAANAGGVGVSGLEMSQNSARISWDDETLHRHLRDMMRDIHAACVRYGQEDAGHVDYLAGANIAGFVKVADAMLAFGHI